jgi:flagellar FliL protein
VFVPLEPFTVNLADREAERYAQIGMTLEIEDAKVGDQIKAVHAGHPQQHPDGHCRPHGRRPDGPRRQDASWPNASCARPRAPWAMTSVEDEPTEEAAAAAEDDRTGQEARQEKEEVRLQNRCR